MGTTPENKRITVKRVKTYLEHGALISFRSSNRAVSQFEERVMQPFIHPLGVPGRVAYVSIT